MSAKWQDTLEQRQQNLKDSALWRSRKELASPQQTHIEVGGSKLINFSSNDYLGLASLDQLKGQAIKQIEQWGVGSGASHLVCGHQSPHHELEQSLANFVGAQRAVLFSTGYMANLAVASTFTTMHDLILQDKLNHASLIDGAQLSPAQFKRYAHTNIKHTEQLLINTDYENALIMSDGVFSMDGNVAPLQDLKQLADDQDALLFVDDAHGFACMGSSGRGALELFKLAPVNNVLLMGTLGKAVGSFGAFVAGDELYIEQLIQSARSYIYTTALPPAVAGTSIASINHIIEHGNELRVSLKRNVELFKQGVKQMGLELMESNSPIQPLIIGDEQGALDLSQRLYELGFLVSAIRPPTVPKGTARLRFTFSASHTVDDIDALLMTMTQVITAKGADYGH